MSKEFEHSEMSEFEIKFKDKLFELQTKRIMMTNLEAKMQKEQVQKQNFQRAVEKNKREIQEMSVQLEVAIAAARKSESERMANRELVARQKIQLQTTLMDGENLQEQIRTLEVETVKLKRLLQQSEEKLVKQNILQERCKNKEIQWKKSLDQITFQIKTTETGHQKLMQLFNAVNVASEQVTSLILTKTNLITNLKQENNKLQEQILFFTETLAKMKVNNQTTCKFNEHGDNLIESELNKSLEEMEIIMKEKEKEIIELQKALKMSFDTIKIMEIQNTSLQDEVKVWKCKAEKANCSQSVDNQINRCIEDENSLTPTGKLENKESEEQQQPLIKDIHVKKIEITNSQKLPQINN